jgi:hypothetical protein
VKDPKRVAAGKALAAKNKERLAKIKNPKDTTDIPVKEPSSLSNTQWSIIGGGVCVLLAGLCYWRGNAVKQRPPSSSITKRPVRTTDQSEVEDPFNFE